MNIRQEKRSAILLCIIVISLFLGFKILKYNLCYYTTDLFSSLQVTKSWLEGFPLLWESRNGNTAGMHNNYIALFFSPFTVIWGAKGLFIAHAILLLLSLIYFICTANGFGSGNGFKVIFLFVAALGLGPYSFWIFDNPYLGWFFDLLFIPLAIILGVSVRSGNRVMIIISGLLLIITKEEGPVIACCIHLYNLFATYTGKEGRMVLFVKSARIISVWFFLFIVSMLTIYIANDFKPTKIAVALENYMRLPLEAKISYYADELLKLFLLLVPVILFLISVFKVRTIGFIVLALVPLIITGLISGFIYLPNGNFSVTWTARFSGILGFITAAVILSTNENLIAKSRLLYFTRNVSYFFILFLLCISLQFISLNYIKNYNLLDQVLAVKNSDLPATVSTERIAILKCISNAITPGSVVVIPEYYYNLFEYHSYAWLDNLSNAEREPEIIILTDSSQLKHKDIDLGNYQVSKIDTFYILENTSNTFNIEKCRIKSGF